MTTLTFTGNNYNEIMAQVVLYMQQIGAKIMPLQAPAEPTPATGKNLVPFPAPAAPTAGPVIPVVPIAAPVAAPQTIPPAPVPTAVPDYTHEQLGRAVASWIDKSPDNRAKALALLQVMGVHGVTQLSTAALRGAFAQALREQGVQI